MPYPQIKEHCPKSKLLLVGTKLDLWQSAEYSNRAIPQDRIEEVIQSISKFRPFTKCIAKIHAHVKSCTQPLLPYPEH